MNPDKKYMSQANLDDKDIKFIPPAFIYRDPHKEFCPNENNRNLEVFPSKTGFPELCNYSDEQEDSLSRECGINISDNSLPITFEGLRHLDLDEAEDLDRENSDKCANKVYLEIEQKHPGIFATLYSYRIPRPIVRVIIKRLIRLTLSYCKNK